MISYKYKLCKSKKLKTLDYMMDEAAFVWNHALALQKRYYRLCGSYISAVRMQKHFARHVKRCRLDAQTVQELLQRQKAAYKKFFKHENRRPPKFRRARDFSSIAFMVRIACGAQEPFSIIPIVLFWNWRSVR